jgi:hypothetical protein
MNILDAYGKDGSFYILVTPNASFYWIEPASYQDIAIMGRLGIFGGYLPKDAVFFIECTEYGLGELRYHNSPNDNFLPVWLTEEWKKKNSIQERVSSLVSEIRELYFTYLDIIINADKEKESLKKEALSKYIPFHDKDDDRRLNAWKNFCSIRDNLVLKYNNINKEAETNMLNSMSIMHGYVPSGHNPGMWKNESLISNIAGQLEYHNFYYMNA